MTITLRHKHQEWLEAQVKAGAYNSIDEAVISIIAGRMHLDTEEKASRNEHRAHLVARLGKPGG